MKFVDQPVGHHTRLLHRAVTRFVYGDQHDPVRAFGRLGRKLAQERGDDSVLHRVARSVAEALRLPYVAVREADRTTVVSYGTAVGDAPPYEVPLRYAGRSVGALLVSRRTRGAGLSAADRALLELVAGPVGIALDAARLADDLAASQQRVLAATEEERARLRRDLHDELGPSLSGIAPGLEAAQLARDDTVLRDELLARLREEVQGAVTEVRRLVDGLRPAALDRAVRRGRGRAWSGVRLVAVAGGRGAAGILSTDIEAATRSRPERRTRPLPRSVQPRPADRRRRRPRRPRGSPTTCLSCG